ncbi:MAG: TVP38/TMEM64 family protein [Rhodospirillaceae bacterium]|jgi:uncharacterized membrane protein YdjX (TVP38/TMEM64 family)|nr:TVP38/TMEM64 family protein [Rhodospirillaceae bacterium]MBT6139718.1 TVP38/TMEM64 family protein [Rhodospirillaceae bacterium]
MEAVIQNKPILHRLWPVAILVLGFIGFFVAGLNDYLTFETLRDNREYLATVVAEHAVLTATAFLALYIVVVAFSLPVAAPISIAGGLMFGIVGGSVLVVVGATIGSALVFLIARSAIGDSLRRRAGPWVRRLEVGFRDNALSYMLVLRLVPLFPFWLVNVVPALLGVRCKTYMLATFFGIIPGTVVYVGVGDGLGMVFEKGQTPDLGLIFEPRILGPILGLAALSFLPVLYKRFRRTSDTV